MIYILLLEITLLTSSVLCNILCKVFWVCYCQMIHISKWKKMHLKIIFLFTYCLKMQIVSYYYWFTIEDNINFVLWIWILSTSSSLFRFLKYIFYGDLVNEKKSLCMLSLPVILCSIQLWNPVDYNVFSLKTFWYFQEFIFMFAFLF